MAYRGTTKANLRQTSYNVAAAALTAQTLSPSIENLHAIADEVYAELIKSWDEDQEELKKETSSSRRRQGRSGGDNPDPGSMVFRAGKHANKTVAQVYQEAPDYLEWYVNNAKNAFMKRIINEFMEGVAAYGESAVTPANSSTEDEEIPF